MKLPVMPRSSTRRVHWCLALLGDVNFIWRIFWHLSSLLKKGWTFDGKKEPCKTNGNLGEFLTLVDVKSSIYLACQVGGEAVPWFHDEVQVLDTKWHLCVPKNDIINTSSRKQILVRLLLKKGHCFWQRVCLPALGQVTKARAGFSISSRVLEWVWFSYSTQCLPGRDILRVFWGGGGGGLKTILKQCNQPENLWNFNV